MGHWPAPWPAAPVPIRIRPARPSPPRRAPGRAPPVRPLAIAAVEPPAAPATSGGTGTTGSSGGSSTGAPPDAGCGCDAGTFCDPGAGPSCLNCLTDADCTGAQSVCQNSAAVLNYGQCVDCTEAEPTCPPGELCDLSLGKTYQQCVPDCRAQDGGCALPLYCSHVTGTCTSQCTADADCPSVLPRCRVGSGHCVECLGPGDCSFSQPGCYTYLNQCGGCDLDADCPTGMTCNPGGMCACTATPQCGGNAPQCVIGAGDDAGLCGCATDDDCASQQAVCAPQGSAGACLAPCNDGGTDCVALNQSCDLDSGLCGPCTSDSQCAGDPRGSYCQLNPGVCGCQSSADCAPTLVCSNDYPSRCIPSCAIVGGTDCSVLPAPNQFCDMDSGSCSPCVQDSQCMAIDAGVGCYLGNCVQCRTASQCPSDNAGCNSFSFTCGSCDQSSDCPSYLPTCLNAVCSVGCVLPDSGTYCLSGVCQLSTGYCVDCLQDMDCLLPNLPRCSADLDAGNACVQCLAASDCGDAGPCNGAVFSCGTCASDADCPTAAPTCLGAPSGSCSDAGS